MQRTNTWVAILLGSAIAMPVFAQHRAPLKSDWHDFRDATSELGNGIGNVGRVDCIVGTGSQPADYAGNMLVDCDGEVPHNETTIAVDPNDENHAVAGYHSYRLVTVSSGIQKLHIVGATSVTTDGGYNWREVVPKITGYQFTGDPALAFTSRGRIYFSNIADNEGQGGGNFSGPDIVVAFSDDGGLTYTDPITVARGKGAVDRSGNGTLVFNDKQFIAADASATSTYRDRAYITWTKFQEKFSSGRSPVYARSPIAISFSDDGVRWSAGNEISGSSAECSVPVPGRCDRNQFSYPAVAPGGKVYVSFENFNTPAENQTLVVSSADGGRTFSAPVRVDALYDINFPANIEGRDTLAGCQFRVIAAGNIAADPSDPTGQTVYVVWADNRNGSANTTNMDVFLARSADGGLSWATHVVDSASNDQFFPWVAVAPDGRVDLGYMDRAYSASQSECKYGFSLTRLTFDSDGTLSSSAKARLDTALSDPGHSRWFSATTDGNGRFIGDYNGVAVGLDGRTWSLWTDQRNIVADPPSPTRDHGQHAVGAVTP